MISATFAAPHRPLTNFLVSSLRLLASSRPWAAALFGVLSLVSGSLWLVTLFFLTAAGFGVVMTSTGQPMLLIMGAIAAAGLAMLLVAAWLSTWGARAELWRVNAFFGTAIPSSYRPPPAGYWRDRLHAFVLDPATWRRLAYMIVLFPIGILEFAIVTVAVSVPFALLIHPFWHWADAILGNDHTTHSAPQAMGLGLLGIPFLLVMPHVLVGMGALHTGLARYLLGPSREAELEERVDLLTVSRSMAVNAALVERRRIERDLHDGAQQRLVALAMDLGMAKLKLESDPEAARQLVDHAHQEAKLAMAEIRSLVQGIHPAVLTDRGLDAALSSLAARCPIPVALLTEMEGRPPAAVESAAYFVVAEALTNVAKHSAASEASVLVRREVGRLVVEVCDNGLGGANAEGGGLSGLAHRVAALDGRLTVESPPGGPTLVRAELPCGWS
jgi:signal transduction histidine kinase